MGVKMDKPEIKKYNCYWPGCGHVFHREVRKVEGKIPAPHYKGKKGNISSFIICPKCKNGLKTWD